MWKLWRLNRFFQARSPIVSNCLSYYSVITYVHVWDLQNNSYFKWMTTFLNPRTSVWKFYLSYFFCVLVLCFTASALSYKWLSFYKIVVCGIYYRINTNHVKSWRKSCLIKFVYAWYKYATLCQKQMACPREWCLTNCMTLFTCGM